MKKFFTYDNLFLSFAFVGGLFIGHLILGYF